MKRFSAKILSLVITAAVSVTVPVSYAYGTGETDTQENGTAVTHSTETDSYNNGYTYDNNDTYSTDDTDSESDETYSTDGMNDGSDETYSTDDADGESDESGEVTNSAAKDTSWFDYDNPKKSYTIKTAGQLIGLASLVNEEQADRWKPTRTENFKGVTFTLAADIELTGEWEPIGSDKSISFAGTFDGDGHTISGVQINSSYASTGFFGYLVGEVRNLNIEGTIRTDAGSCGSIAGVLSDTGKITNCTSNVTISAGHKTGGIAGYNYGGTIESCTNTGNISGTFKVGGITGENWGGKILQCSNRGRINSSERGVATYGTGGVAGRSVSAAAEVTECYNTGDIYSNTEATGGIAGYVNAAGSVIKNCYNTGNITIKSSSAAKKASNSKALKNSAKQKKNNDSVSCCAGGIAGTVGVKGVKITNCYNVGEINNADIFGGLIGSYLNDDDEDVSGSYIRNNYYSHDSIKVGIGYCESEGTNEVSKASTSVSSYSLMNMSLALGSAYMKDSSYMYGNKGYPVLTWQQPVSDEEKVYIKNISKDIQKKLDKYMMKLSKSKMPGNTVINIFNPDNVTSSSLVKYIEAQEKHAGISESENTGE